MTRAAASSKAAAAADAAGMLAASAPLPPRPRRARKALKAEEREINQQRCKAFRAKRKKYEDDLQVAVYMLRAQVAELTARRALEDERAMSQRHALTGSLVQVAREMKYMLRYGVQLHVPPHLRDYSATQRAFVNSVMVPHARGNCGDILTVMGLFEACYERMFMEIGDAVVSGTEDDPMVTLRTKVHVQYGPRTFQTMFPDLQDPLLIHRLLDRTVVYDTQSFFRFTRDGRIYQYDCNMDIPNGLLQALGSVEDTMMLLTPRTQFILQQINGGQERFNSVVAALPKDLHESEFASAIERVVDCEYEYELQQGKREAYAVEEVAAHEERQIHQMGCGLSRGIADDEMDVTKNAILAQKHNLSFLLT